MLTESRFTISYTGPAVEHGEVGPEHFQDALEGLVELIERAALLINGADCRVTVELTPAGLGSWNVHVQCVHGRGQATARWITGGLGLTRWPECQDGGLSLIGLLRAEGGARRCLGAGARLVH